jgi:DNA invertase Pin-like site-specific DNA recombinase
VKQEVDLQLDALVAAGCESIYSDKISGTKTDRPELNKALAALVAGDTLVVWRLDRLGRSMQHLVDTIGSLQNRGIGFKAISGDIDTTTASGKLVFHIFAALAEFERGLIVERTKAGLAAAYARGKKSGPKWKLDSGQREEVIRLLASGVSMFEASKLFGVSEATIWRVSKGYPQGFNERHCRMKK